MNFTKISRELIKTLKFEPFTQNDYFGFAGVESPVPLIAENQNEGILMVIDGDYAELYAFDGDGNMELVDSVDSIRNLPVKTQTQIQIEKLEAELAILKKLV